MLMQQSEHGFKCLVCNDFHEIPKTGFLKNSNLAKLCDKEAAELSRTKLAEAFKSQLDELKLKLDQLTSENKQGLENIKEFYEGLTNLNEHDLCSLPNFSLPNPSPRFIV
jgi:hypothetical protein